MLLFLLSFFMIILSSYLFISNFAPRKYALGFIYFLLTAFAQIVLTFEILSLISAISVKGVLFLNLIFLITSIFVFIKFGKNFYIPNFKEFLKNIFKAFKADKILFIMAIGFIFFLIISFIMCLFLPVVNYDAMAYHLARVPYWVLQGNLNHFDCLDFRALIMPINSELLYSWVFVFFKNDVGLFLFSYVGFIMSITILYNFLAFLGYCERKKIWAVIILSSLTSILLQITSIETDVILGGLVFSSLFLFLNYLKNPKLSFVFFSALSYALAVGTKTPAIFAIPACFTFSLIMAYKIKGKDFLKPIGIFIGFFLLNFLIFSSYNYILNFIDYGNFISCHSSYVVHRAFGGYKAYISNFIKHLYMFFDFSGFSYVKYFEQYIIKSRDFLIGLLGISPDYGSRVIEGTTINSINNSILTIYAGFGILGMLLAFPSLIIALFVGMFKIKSKKAFVLMLFSYTFFLNVIILSCTMAFMLYNIRFITFFFIISSCVLVYSYIKRETIGKIIILFFVLSYLIVISTHIYDRNLFNLYSFYKQRASLSDFRNSYRALLDNVGKVFILNPAYILRVQISHLPQNSKIGFFPSSGDRLYPIKILEYKGYSFKTLSLNQIEDYDLSHYDYLIFTKLIQFVYLTEKENININYEISNPKTGQGYFLKSNNFINKCIYYKNFEEILTKDDLKNGVKAVWANCETPFKYLEKHNFVLKKHILINSPIPENAYYYLIFKKIK